jgi:hypothetical protein
MLCGKGSLISLILRHKNGLTSGLTRGWRQSSDVSPTPPDGLTSGATTKILPVFKTKSLGNNLSGLTYTQNKERKIMSRRRGRSPRGKLRRRNHCCSTLTPPFLQFWKPSPLRTGAGLGRLAGRSCWEGLRRESKRWWTRCVCLPLSVWAGASGATPGMVHPTKIQATVHFEVAHIDDIGSHQHTRAVGLWHEKTRCREVS